MEASDLVEERVTLEFRGSTAGTLLRYLIAWILTQLIFPTAWGTAILYRWVVKRTRFSDGTKATFEGQPGQVWGWLALSAGIGYGPAVVLNAIIGTDPFAMFFDSEALQAALGEGDSVVRAVYWALMFLAWPVIIYVELVIYRWGIAGIRLEKGPDLRFTGEYPRLLGWNTLVVLSVLTIVGWAWVGTAFLRWFANEIEGAGIRFEFVGSGWGLFWRLFPVYLVALSVTPLIALHATYPWWTFLIMWFIVGAVELILLTRWLISNTVMVKGTTSAGKAPETATQVTTTPAAGALADAAPGTATPAPADRPPGVPFPLVVESKYR